MTSTNGHDLKQAILYVILYARVSTDEQARSGYSLAQQMEALREYAAREGYEVLEEVTDPGQSGASLERPGMDRVRDLVAAGGVSVVFAQDRDRFAREPAYHYLLKKEFEEHGAKLRSLNDHGDDSPEGELADGVLDQFAKYQRAKFTEGSRRGKRRKAKEGKIIANHSVNYGFSLNAARDGYEVDEEAMCLVRRIFRMIGVEGKPIYAVKRAFALEGIPTPSGKNQTWSSPQIRKIVTNDVYRPHAYEEIKELVSPEVAAPLDAKTSYGIWWWGRRRHTLKQVSENGPDGRSYRKKKRSRPVASGEWVAVPVPDSGIPLEWVDAARQAIKDNPRPQRSVWKFWELAGMARCAGCGRQMARSAARNNAGTRFFYYRCSKRWQDGKDACPNNKSFNALKVEPQVWELVSGLVKDPEQLRSDLERMIELEREGTRGDPEQDAKAWLDELAKADRKRDKYQEAFAADAMTLDELRSKLASLEEARKTAERELEALKSRWERIAELERDKEALLEHYAALAPEALAALTPEERHDLYGMLKLGVVFHPDKSLEVTGAFADDFLVSDLETRRLWSS